MIEIGDTVSVDLRGGYGTIHFGTVQGIRPDDNWHDYFIVNFRGKNKGGLGNHKDNGCTWAFKESRVSLSSNRTLLVEKK